jgi:succinate dehydrogenase / fumarate reductase iron-sulfur subunit
VNFLEKEPVGPILFELGEVLMKVNLKVFRYNPEKDKKPYYQTYTLEAEPTDRILDLLEHIKGYEDGTLSFRRSCAHGICGSDAVRINGVNRLACKVLVKDLGRKVTVEPILGLKVIKDLIVDMEPFFDHYKSVMPYFVNDDPPPQKERLQSPEDRERFDDTTKCILCACCTTSCPSFWANENYVGPAAIVNAHRFIFDSRDQAAAERLKILNDQFGVFRCHTIFNCTDACPREIQVTQAVGEVKKAIATARLD